MCDKKNYYKLGENIRGLRRMFGESQLDLATAIGVGTSAISNYEIGERNPDQDVLIRIAKHYRITEDELRNSDFSNTNKIVFPNLKNPSLQKNYLETIFPIVSSENALQNEDFKKAYDLHISLYNGIAEQEIPTDEDFTACIKHYKVAIDQDIYEARINYLGLIILQGIVFSLFTPTLLFLMETPNLYSLSSKTIIQSILPSFGDALDNEDEKEWEALKDEFHQNNIVDTLVNIALLKKYNDYSDYGDYFLAWSYIVGLTASGQTPEMSAALGLDLLSTLSIIGNKHAKRFFKFFEK